MIHEVDDLRGNSFCRTDFVHGDSGWPNSQVERQVGEYDPQNEVLLLIQRPTGELSCLRLRAPSGQLPPRAACEEAYRNAQGPLDFERLMKNQAIQYFLGALRLNLEAFHAKGLELGDLCSCVFCGDLCVARAVLLSALKDRILIVDDSDGKCLWKSGPDWTKLEEILLSQDETEAHPSWLEPWWMDLDFSNPPPTIH